MEENKSENFVTANTINGYFYSAGTSYIASSPSSYTYVDPADLYEVSFRKISEFLKEDEINDILNALNSRCTDRSFVRDSVRTVVRNKHVSEEFLLNWYEYLSKDDIMKFHKSEIVSQEYANIAVLIQTEV